MDAKKALRSGELAKLVGVSADTLRLYERKGLLARPPRAANGYRCYPREAVERVRLIRAALSIGFTIGELGEILGARDRGGAPCAQVRGLAGEKLRNLERHIRELAGLRDELRQVLKQWDRRLKETPSGQRARLLEAIAGLSDAGRRTLAPQLYASLAGKSIHKEKRK